jgi:RNA polymerase sigma-70 factor (ECF subfamily)
MQDVFQNIWQTAGGFRHQSGAVVGWIIGITRHRAIDTLLANENGLAIVS